MLISFWAVPLFIWIAARISQTTEGSYAFQLGTALLIVPFLCHLTQFVTGIPFAHLYQKWNQLKPWQRGVFGIIIAAGVLFLFVIGVATICPLIFK